MPRLLKAIHIGLILLFTLYAGGAVIGYGIKLISPSNPLVRYWQPGAGSGGRRVCLGGFARHTRLFHRIVKNPPLRVSVLLSVAWLACFSWFAWVSHDSPFRLQEIGGN